jgi:hypothetical protein
MNVHEQQYGCTGEGQRALCVFGELLAIIVVIFSVVKLRNTPYGNATGHWTSSPYSRIYFRYCSRNACSGSLVRHDPPWRPCPDSLYRTDATRMMIIGLEETLTCLYLGASSM